MRPTRQLWAGRRRRSNSILITFSVYIAGGSARDWLSAGAVVVAAAVSTPHTARSRFIKRPATTQTTREIPEETLSEIPPFRRVSRSSLRVRYTLPSAQPSTTATINPSSRNVSPRSFLNSRLHNNTANHYFAVQDDRE